jgi:hypothetical protein
MTPQQRTDQEVLDALHAGFQRDRAFAEALTELFRRHPLPEYVHEMHPAVRSSALRKAKSGGYRDYAPGGMQRWRNQLRENAEDWGIPPDELITIHTLIYG